MASHLIKKCSITTVRSYVSSYANEKRQELAQKFMELKASGSRFSMTSDEWTSTSATRYLNIVLKASDEHHNLGLERIRGKADAQNILDTLLKLLSKFGIHLSKDIISCTFDGAAVMLKMGREISPFALICHAHGLHLAVTDVLYKNDKRSSAKKAIIEDVDEDIFKKESNFAW